MLEPLFALRLRTPRLELRLPDNRELIELRELAHSGIHPPDEMPFGVAWTDEPYSEDFLVAYYRQQMDAWRPESWNLNLGVWAGGQVVGSQSVHGDGFVSSHILKTGSWLGLAFQRQGYGTEMRTAVLELAFRVLGADAVRSGVIDGNVASRRVSEKLGYRSVLRETIAPRGIALGHTIFELRREDWRPPFEVQIEGLSAAARKLFG
jgi:RimJ/RimL family protein N-acetyltransferase